MKCYKSKIQKYSTSINLYTQNIYMYVRSGIKIAHIHMPIRTQTTHNNQNKTKQKKNAKN